MFMYKIILMLNQVDVEFQKPPFSGFFENFHLSKIVWFKYFFSSVFRYPFFIFIVFQINNQILRPCLPNSVKFVNKVTESQKSMWLWTKSLREQGAEQMVAWEGSIMPSGFRCLSRAIYNQTKKYNKFPKTGHPKF